MKNSQLVQLVQYNFLKYRGLIVENGFTLIELLVVIGLIGVLSLGLMTVINPIDQLQKGEDTRRKSDLATIQKALELYYNDHGAYPRHGTGWKIRNSSNQILQWGTGSFTPYMQRLPADPDTKKSYAYYSNGESYWLFASLDRGKKDKEACGDTACGRASSLSLTCGTGICNYGVTSPNTTRD